MSDASSTPAEEQKPDAGGPAGDEAGLPRVKSEKELQKEKKRLEKLAKFEAKQQKKATEAAQKKNKDDSEVITVYQLYST